MKELKQSHNFDAERRKALTQPEQALLMDFLSKSEQYRHWCPIMTVMLEAGLRVGEATGLRWEDIDLENGTIDVNHTLVYYSHANKNCCFGVNTPKTAEGRRVVPMTKAVKEAFE